MIQFIHPWTGIVSGPTSCGKTFFMKTFIDNISLLVDKKIDRIIWYYDEYQPLYDKIKAEFKQGFPDLNDFDGRQSTLIILDDLMRETNSHIVDIFTKGSHHRNLSVFYITQNIFHQARGQRDISLNTHYLVVFKNARDRAQISHLARQVCPENPKFVQEAYSDATKNPHGYILFDFKQTTPEMFRIRSNIFTNEGFPHQYVYIPKKGYKYISSSEYMLN